MFGVILNLNAGNLYRCVYLINLMKNVSIRMDFLTIKKVPTERCRVAVFLPSSNGQTIATDMRVVPYILSYKRDIYSRNMAVYIGTIAIYRLSKKPCPFLYTKSGYVKMGKTPWTTSTLLVIIGHLEGNCISKV